MILIIKKRETACAGIDNPDFTIAKSLCALKQYQCEPYVIVLLDAEIDDNGILKELSCFLEELFVALDIIAIISLKTPKILQDLCAYYNVPLFSVDK